MKHSKRSKFRIDRTGKKGSARLAEDISFRTIWNIAFIIVSARWRNVRTYSWKCLDFHKNGPYRLHPICPCPFWQLGRKSSFPSSDYEKSEWGKCQVLHMYYTPSPRSTILSWEKSARSMLRVSARLADFATLAHSFMRSLTARYALGDHYGFTTKSTCSIAPYY